MQIKVTYKSDTKKIKQPQSFSDLVQASSRAFGELEPNSKFFYIDSDFDVISITSQDDLEEALLAMHHLPVLKLLICSSIEEARTTFEKMKALPEDSVRFSSLNQYNASNFSMRPSVQPGLNSHREFEPMFNKDQLLKDDVQVSNQQQNQTGRHSMDPFNYQKLVAERREHNAGKDNQKLVNDLENDMEFVNVEDPHKDAPSQIFQQIVLEDSKGNIMENSEDFNKSEEQNKNQQPMVEVMKESERYEESQDARFQNLLNAVNENPKEQMKRNSTKMIRIDKENEFSESQNREVEEEIHKTFENQTTEINREESKASEEVPQALEVAQVVKEEVKQEEPEVKKEEPKVEEEVSKVPEIIPPISQQPLVFDVVKEEDKEESQQIEKPNFNDLEQEVKNGIYCFKCDGLGKTKKGKECRKCRGTGKLSEKFFYDVLNLIQEEIKLNAPKLFEKFSHKSDQQSMEFQPRESEVFVFHQGVECSRCFMKPIKGTLYRSYFKPEINFCENCEKIDDFAINNPMVKIRRPELDPLQMNIPVNEIPANMIMSNYQSAFEVSQANPPPSNKFDVEQSAINYPGNQSNLFDINNNNESQVSEYIPPKNQQNYKAKFQKENFGDNYTVHSGEQFTKVWTFRNDGTEPWPYNTRFIYTNGDQFGPLNLKITKMVEPGEYLDVEMVFTAPSKPGKYTSFYRFCGDDQKFGQKVWCDIRVVEEDEILKLQDMMGSFDQKERQNIFSSNRDKDQLQHQQQYGGYQPPAPQIAHPQPVVEEQKHSSHVQEEQKREYSSLVDDVSVNVEDKKKIEYINKVETMQKQHLRASMMFLLEMGYSDFQKNQQLLIKYNGKLDLVANILASQT